MTSRALGQRLAWHGAHLPLRHHFILLLCVFACALMLYRAVSLRQEVQAAESRLRYQNTIANNAGHSANAIDASARFLSFFPQKDPTEDFLKQVYKEAGKLGIKVTQVSLEAATQPMPGLNKQGIAVTLAAPDAAYRELVYTLLSHAPAISLARMSVNHNERGDFQIDLVWGIFSQ